VFVTGPGFPEFLRSLLVVGRTSVAPLMLADGDGRLRAHRCNAEAVVARGRREAVSLGPAGIATLVADEGGAVVPCRKAHAPDFFSIGPHMERQFDSPPLDLGRIARSPSADFGRARAGGGPPAVGAGDENSTVEAEGRWPRICPGGRGPRAMGDFLVCWGVRRLRDLGPRRLRARIGRGQRVDFPGATLGSGGG